MAVHHRLIIIYRLRDDFEEIFYVGRTGDPDQRLEQHRRAFGYIPVMEFLEAIPRACGKWYVKQAERDLIEFHLLGGYRLINLKGVDGKLWERVGDITYPLKRARQCWRLRSVEEMRIRRYRNKDYRPNPTAEDRLAYYEKFVGSFYGVG